MCPDADADADSDAGIVGIIITIILLIVVAVISAVVYIKKVQSKEYDLDTTYKRDITFTRDSAERDAVPDSVGAQLPQPRGAPCKDGSSILGQTVSSPRRFSNLGMPHCMRLKVDY